METKPTISAALVVWNEEKLIRDCLESIKDAVDEIVVIHDGPCSDNTLEIAREYTDKIIIHPRIGSAEPIRPYAFKLSKGDWILSIDADERLSPELKDNLLELIAYNDINSYSFLWIFYDKNGPIKNSIRRKKMLFRKSSMYHVGLPHIISEVVGRESQTNFIVEHYWDIKQIKSLFSTYIRKNVKIAKIAAKMLSGNTEDIPVFQTSLWSSKFKHHRKFKLLQKHPLIAMWVLPSYSFFYHFIANKYYRDGYLGFSVSLEMPSYYFITALFLIKEKTRRRLNGR